MLLLLREPVCAFEGHWIRDLSSSIPKAAAQRAGNSCQSSGHPAAWSVCPPRAPLPPSCPLTRVSVVGGVSRHREHLAPGHPPPLLSSPFSLHLPLTGPRWGVRNEVSHLHSGKQQEVVQALERGQTTQFEGYFKTPGRQILYLLLQDSMHKDEVQSSSVSVYAVITREDLLNIKEGKKNTEINLQV